MRLCCASEASHQHVLHKQQTQREGGTPRQQLVEQRYSAVVRCGPFLLVQLLTLDCMNPFCCSVAMVCPSLSWGHRAVVCMGWLSTQQPSHCSQGSHDSRG
jgi:hypothetical protein